ncbi:MAG: pyridoxal-phosphate dependent enzyme [Myxococcota bacterium]
MTDNLLPLVRRYPGLEGRLVRVPLMAGPTAVEQLQLPLGSPYRAPRDGLWIKRDDCTGVRYGGNKVRKLEFLLGDALADGYDTVWTVGAIGSHHALATAIYGEQLGLEVHLIHTPQPVSDHVRRNVRAVAATSAHLRLTQHPLGVPLRAAQLQLRRRLFHGRRAYRIPLGGSNPLGTLGYVNAAFELSEQIAAGRLPCPRRIYVPVGSCGTFAGLWLGCKLAQLDLDVVGVRVVPLAVGNPWVAALLIRATSTLLHALDPTVPRLTPDPRTLSIRHIYAGAGYGLPTERGRNASTLLKAMDVKTDPTYTAKTASALLDELARVNLRPDGPVLFWNTLSSVDLEAGLGGPLPALNRLPNRYQHLLERTTHRIAP